MKHPSTDRFLVLHETPQAPDKPHYHHYGVRVATIRNDNAYDYPRKKNKSSA